VTDRYC